MPAVPSGAVSILVVDDDDMLRLVLRRMLETAGYEVREAPNGKVAMLEFSRQPADLLITDIFMPEQEGLETISALRREYPGLRIIAISGVGGNHYLKLAKFMGVRATLLKPLRKGTVLEAVKTTLEQSQDAA